MKAIKKRIEVDAHQFIKVDPLWPAGVFENPTVPGQYHIITLEGRMDVQDRAYIITGVKGEKWAIREDVFKETYDVLPVETHTCVWEDESVPGGGSYQKCRCGKVTGLNYAT